MKCEFIQSLIREYFKNNPKKLSEEHLAVMRGHLKKCGGCLWMYWSLKLKSVSNIIIVSVLSIGVIAGVSLYFSEKKPVKDTPAPRTAKVISNVILEVFSSDSRADLKAAEEAAEDFKADIIYRDPLSVKLVKGKVKDFIKELDMFLDLPANTLFRVEDFIKPLRDHDEVIIKIKFLAAPVGK